MHWARGERDIPVFVLPRDGMLQPVLVVALVIIFSRMRSARLRACDSRMGDENGLIRKIGKLQSGDQLDIPKQRIVVDGYLVKRIAQRRQLVHSFLQRIAATEHAEVRLHDPLHLWTNLTRFASALAPADPIKALQRALFRMTVCLAYERTRLDDLGRALCCSTPENDQIEQAVRAQSIGAMNRAARRSAIRL